MTYVLDGEGEDFECPDLLRVPGANGGVTTPASDTVNISIDLLMPLFAVLCVTFNFMPRSRYG